MPFTSSNLVSLKRANTLKTQMFDDTAEVIILLRKDQLFLSFQSFRQMCYFSPVIQQRVYVI